jgi:hypothetical protein
MKRFLTTAAIITALALPAFAEGDDQSAPAGEPKGSAAKASTDQKQDAGRGAMGQGAIVAPAAAPRATTGSSPSDQQLNKSENSSPANAGDKTGVSGGKGN